MTQYLLDTNVISETARQAPHVQALEWIRSLGSLQLPAIAVYELASGVRRVPAGRRRRFLEEWFAELMGSDCTVLPLDREGALACADLEVAARQQKRVVEHRDLLILGIAKAHSLGVATRNVAHFRGLNVPVYDPFENVHAL